MGKQPLLKYFISFSLTCLLPFQLTNASYRGGMNMQKTEDAFIEMNALAEQAGGYFLFSC